MFNVERKQQAKLRYEKKKQEYDELLRAINSSAKNLYSLRKSASDAIRRIEDYINTLANTPKELKKDIADISLSIKDFRDSVELENEINIGLVDVGNLGIAGLGTAIGFAGATGAMAFATTFGVASTGTAIASLSGAAATNAALAALGGGALAVGGGGMAAGKALLVALGPVGWSIAGIMLAKGGFDFMMKNIDTIIAFDTAWIQLNHAYTPTKKAESELKHLEETTQLLKGKLGITLFVNTYPKDYENFNDEQKMALVTLINNARAMGELINQRIELKQ